MEELSFKFVLDYTTFLNVNRFFSYDDISLFLLTGGRGIGKTTGFVSHSLQDWARTGNEFVYVRRYISELRKAKNMISGILNNDVKVIGRGNGLFEWQINKKRIGYGIALTAQQTIKSGSDFSKVMTMIYDEAILPRFGAYRYLPNEIECLLELISTVFRVRTGYKIFILGNNADIFNPYYEYFDIPRFDTNYKDATRGIYCELCKNSAQLLKKEEQTPLFRLTQGTAYGDYHYENTVLVTEDVKIGTKDRNAKLLCRIVYNTITLNVYRQSLQELFIELRDKVIKDNHTFIIMENNKPNYLYIKEYRMSDVGKLIDMCYYNDGLIFNDFRAGQIMNDFMEVI